MDRPRPMTVTTLTVTESSFIAYDRASTAPKPPRIEAIAPMMGIPAASSPPKTSTMTTREIGNETASARTRSLSITSLMSRPMRWLLDGMELAPGTAAVTSEPNVRRRAITASLATRSSSDDKPSARRTWMTNPFPSEAMNGRIRGSGGAIVHGPTTVLTPKIAARSVRQVAIGFASPDITPVSVTFTPFTRSLTDEPPAESSRIRLAFSEPLPGTRSSDVSSLSKIPWPPTPPIASAADVNRQRQPHGDDDKRVPSREATEGGEHLQTVAQPCHGRVAIELLVMGDLKTRCRSHSIEVHVWSPEIDPQNQNFDGSARCRSAIPTHNQHLDGMRWVATLRDVARLRRATLRDRGGDAYPAARVEGSRHADECDRA